MEDKKHWMEVAFGIRYLNGVPFIQSCSKKSHQKRAQKILEAFTKNN